LQNPLRQLPLRDSIDLNDENNQRLFIMNMRRLKLEIQVKKMTVQMNALEDQN
jgi:hypothetical protein